MPSRVVHHDEALRWLSENALPQGSSVITSLPDLSELAPMTLPEWRLWFVDAAKRVMSACPDDGVCLFYQTDIIDEGVWIDKGHLVQTAADALELPLLWHRIVCRMAPGTPHFGRPAYAHLLAFSRTVKPLSGHARRDVLPDTGEMTWSRAMGIAACVEACRFVQTHARSHTIIDPFCGHGTVLAVANAMGMDAIGVELSRKRVKKAKALKVGLESPGTT